jgi:hypothetical protein
MKFLYVFVNGSRHEVSDPLAGNHSLTDLSRRDVECSDVDEVHPISIGFLFLLDLSPQISRLDASQIAQPRDRPLRQQGFRRDCPHSRSGNENKIVRVEQLAARSPAGHILKRIFTGYEIELRPRAAARMGQFAQRVNGKRARRGLELRHGRQKRRKTGRSQSHHGISMVEWNHALDGLVRRSSGHHEVNVRKAEESLGAISDVEMTQMDGIERAAKNSYSHRAQVESSWSDASTPMRPDAQAFSGSRLLETKQLTQDLNQFGDPLAGHRRDFVEGKVVA